MSKIDSVLKALRKICLRLPDTEETPTWGKPHFRVAGKIFAGYGEDKGTPVVSFKLEMGHAELVVQQPGFRRAPYVGHKGWVSMDVTRVKDRKLWQSMLEESYCLIAPKRTLARLDGVASKPPGEGATGKTVARRTAAGKRPAKKPTRKVAANKIVRKVARKKKSSSQSSGR